ncbi:hypothetical protein DM02DRAFT_674141 [Periconia macrospinosa]|uniref:Uncharacterized protein n=1 Tax=Periconia macrospinosa TaxID=97972 RepID=A0A2V1DJK1_9PLEO|nr:hypothetical protein DM02DRAFT_674141 [Periconia macrospinosa]
MKAAVLLVAVIPTIVSGWRIRLYRNTQYEASSIIEDRSGTVGQPCKNLASKNVASSMHWDNGALNCNIRLFDGNDCNGAILGDAKYGDWNVPDFSSVADNKVNSYNIDC